MSLLVKHDWSDATVPWLEDHLQMAMAQTLHRLEAERGDFTFAADMNGMKASSRMVAARAKLMGMRAGEADLRIYHRAGRLQMLEVKRYPDGVLTESQEERHPVLENLGHDLTVIWAETPDQAVAAMMFFLRFDR